MLRKNQKKLRKNLKKLRKKLKKQRKFLQSQGLKVKILILCRLVKGLCFQNLRLEIRDFILNKLK